MAIRQVSFGAPAAQSPLVQALAPRDPRQMLAIQALQEGSSTAPVQSIGEGLARVAQGALGGWFAGRQKRESEEASGRLADAILSGMPEAQRNGPQGAWMRAALQDETLRGPIVAAYAQSNMTPRDQWVPDPTGMFQVNTLTGERRPLETVERHRAMAEAGRDPLASVRVVQGQDGGPPLAVNLREVMGGGQGQPLAAAESGMRPGAVNPGGYSGLYQFGAPRLAELGMYQPGQGEDLRNWQPGQTQWTGRLNIPGMPDIQTQQQFLASPQAQQVAFRAHLANIDERLAPVLRDMNGREVGGVPITANSLRAMAHLGGVDGVYRFLSTGGQYNPADANGTRLSDYGRRFANVDIGASGPTQTAQAPAQTATDAGPQYPPGVRPLVSGGSQPTFRGQGIEQQMYNRYLDLDRRRPALNPMEQQELAIVERFLTQPRTTVTDRGVETIQPPPLPRFNPQQTAATPAGPASVAPTATEPGAIAPPANGASASPPAQQPSPQPATPQGPAPRTTTLPGGAQVTTIPRTDRDPPQPIVGAMTENANAVQSIDRAMMALNRYPAAVGVRPGIANLTGWSSMIWDRMDPDGVEVRAAIADIGSLKIHDRSGAAVSAQEFPRLRPFIPQVGDSAETVRTKLLRFREEYMQMLRDQYENYGPAQGYRPLPSVERILTPPTATGQPPPVVRWRRGPNGPEPETQ